MADPITITNEQLAGKVVESVKAVQDAELTVVAEGKRLTTHMADPNAHGQYVNVCVAQGIADHDANVDAHKELKTALEWKIADKADTSALAQKADKDTLATELAKKADVSALVLKADATVMSTELAAKADVSALAEKADATAMAEALAVKADATALAQKADMADLELKADKAEVDALSDRVDTIAETGGGGTITIPTITGPASAPIGYAISYTVSASSGLQNGSIASFRYKFGTNTEKTVNATDGSATIPITVPAGTAVGAKFTLTVVAVDNYGNERSATKEIAAIAASVATPAITSPSAGAVVSAVNIPITGVGFSAIGSTDTQKRRRARICTPEGTVLFTGPWVTELPATSLTLVPSPVLTAKANVRLQMQDEGNALGESPWGAPVSVTVSSVVQPSITSPAANAEVSDKNITVVSSGIALTGGVADTLVGADYTLYDTSGDVIAAAKGIASTSHIFTAPPVVKGTHYDIGVVQHSKNHGASLESTKRRIKIKTTRHGEILYDTSGNPAAVIIGSNASNGMEPWSIRGKQVWLAVALAAKRSVSITWNTSSSDSNWQDISSIENPSVTWKLATSNTGADGSGSYVSSLSSEANMDGSFGYSQAIKDSKALTSAITAHNANYQAAKIARQLVLKDLGAMDLPRIEALMRIYQMREKIDALDPTASANTAKKLAAWGFGSANGAYVWSASEYNSSYAWHVYSNGSLNGNGKDAQFGVVPALEIPA